VNATGARPPTAKQIEDAAEEVHSPRAPHSRPRRSRQLPQGARRSRAKPGRCPAPQGTTRSRLTRPRQTRQALLHPGRQANQNHHRPQYPHAAQHDRVPASQQQKARPRQDPLPSPPSPSPEHETHDKNEKTYTRTSQPPKNRRRFRLASLIQARRRDSPANQDHRSDIRRQRADDGDDQRPPVLLAPPLASFGNGTFCTAWSVVIVAHGRESTPQAAAQPEKPSSHTPAPVT
jgi:hypothetical protein